MNDIKIEVILCSYRWYKRVRFSMQKQGLQVFDANGNIVIDISDSLTRIIGGGTFDGNDSSLKDDKIVGSRVWIRIVSITHATSNPIEKTVGIAPVFTVSGNTISWKYDKSNIKIINGWFGAPTNASYIPVWGDNMSQIKYANCTGNFLYGAY